MAELIDRRRRQIHVHSVMYYQWDTTLVADHVFDAWSNELVDLHRNHPDLIGVGYRPDLFADWTGDTGMHLPATPQITATITALLNDAKVKE